MQSRTRETRTEWDRDKGALMTSQNPPSSGYFKDFGQLEHQTQG